MSRHTARPMRGAHPRRTAEQAAERAAAELMMLEAATIAADDAGLVAGAAGCAIASSR